MGGWRVLEWEGIDCCEGSAGQAGIHASIVESSTKGPMLYSTVKGRPRGACLERTTGYRQSKSIANSHTHRRERIQEPPHRDSVCLPDQLHVNAC
jgi:hypothetical protein